jgi:hypothetical protein
VSSLSPSWFSQVQARPPPAPRAAGGRWTGTCRAVDAETGLRCRLPAHGDKGHRSERGPFHLVAAPGQATFARVEQLAAAAESRCGSDLSDTPRPPSSDARREAKRERDRRNQAAHRERVKAAGGGA